MNELVILTDSSCDLPIELINKMKIEVMPLSILIDDKEFLDCADEHDIKYSTMYNLMRNNKTIKTAAVNIEDFTAAIRRQLVRGKDVLYLGFSSALSSTYNNGATAMKNLADEFPTNRLISIDTLSGASGLGMLIYLTYLKQQQGLSIDQIAEYVNNTKLHLCHWFTVDDLNHLKRGGRISGASAKIGTMLNIKPILKLNDNGEMIVSGKLRGRKPSIDFLFDKAKDYAIDPSEQVMFISHGDCLDDAIYLANRLKSELGVRDVVVNYAGAIVGGHAGPGSLGLFFLASER